eukprot:Nitzschia sp. Nitz4//scaffold180_size44305//20700//22001//NITZ4_007239-RA/size44305-processed-gene-0.21-mRNA-1//-1//CDS//3329539467//2839//frame0
MKHLQKFDVLAGLLSLLALGVQHITCLPSWSSQGLAIMAVAMAFFDFFWNVETTSNKHFGHTAMSHAKTIILASIVLSHRTTQNQNIPNPLAPTAMLTMLTQSPFVPVLSTSCRSNVTHVAWRLESLSIGDALSTPRCLVVPVKHAQRECLHALWHNLMSFDLPFQETLGFPISDVDMSDGLGNGLVQPTIELALQAKILYPWTDELPKDVFMEYVLNFANLNEGRTNWRPLLVDALRFNESALWTSGQANLSSTVTWVNQQLWSRLEPSGKAIRFHSGQTPLIFDPMSIVAFGYASCTGTSILFANALRAVGVPARVAGTPAWYGNRTQGNHNWVEVLAPIPESPGLYEWKFLEPSPNANSPSNVDTLEQDPCRRWFCDSSRYPASQVYAAKLMKHGDAEPPTFFPLAWEWNSQDVPAEDRTKFYADTCGIC